MIILRVGQHHAALEQASLRACAVSSMSCIQHSGSGCANMEQRKTFLASGEADPSRRAAWKAGLGSGTNVSQSRLPTHTPIRQ